MHYLVHCSADVGDSLNESGGTSIWMMSLSHMLMLILQENTLMNSVFEYEFDMSLLSYYCFSVSLASNYHGPG